MVNNIYVIVEGLSDVRYLNQLLGPKFNTAYNLRFYNAGGYHAMLTSGMPIIDQVPAGSKILFLFDADTMSQERADERLSFFKEQIGYVRKLCKIGVFYFLPEIEDVIMGEYESYISRRKTDGKDIIDYIDSYREEILRKKPLSDIVAFLKDTTI